ncbi:KDEL motif-containing protein 1 [Seminavis robusta]|uniref:KDEL motif-containing protein 1 n=1 Tax=Seminavis robusta TaxID=568900 RepID=A0A9N8E4C6_9STRA|nr:KDEL motif-containing protein 1 [Seminavis robusta]|eukprot:Sro606_g174470.1 KDEL motif-containing protein 1 (982) ;mRNA; f:19125-22223
MKASFQSPLRRLGCAKYVMLSLIPLVNQLFPLLWTKNYLGMILFRDRHDFPLVTVSSQTGYNTLEETYDNRQHQELLHLLKRNPKPRILFVRDNAAKSTDATTMPTRLGSMYRLVSNLSDSKVGGKAIRWELPGLREQPKYPLVKGLCEGKGPDCVIPELWLSNRNITACNPIHEIDLSKGPRIVAKGGKRLVWKVSQPVVKKYETGGKFSTTHNATVQRKKRFPNVVLFRLKPPREDDLAALKMFRLSRDMPNDFGPQSIDNQHRDAMIHQLLTSSPNIVNIYGYCGASAVYDFADGGNLQDNILGSTYKKQKKGMQAKPGSGPLHEDELLDVAHQIASSLADLHLLNTHTGEPMISHADIYGPQWVKVRGKYQLTDFNLAKLLVRSKFKNVMYPFTRDVVDNWFAPEVHRQRKVARPSVTYKMDIFQLGNILFMLLVGKPPFGKKKRWDVHKLVTEQQQLVDEIPDMIRYSSDDFAQMALVEIIDWCRQEDPDKRPTARQVVKFLRHKIAVRDKYDSVQTINQRAKRFPSVKERIKVYMSSWYACPCADKKKQKTKKSNGMSSPASSFIQYQYVPSNKKGGGGQDAVLIQAPQTSRDTFSYSWNRIVRLEPGIRTDDAMIIVPAALEGSTNTSSHAGFRNDIVQTLLPFMEMLHDKPIISQWGDKKSLVISSSEATLADTDTTATRENRRPLISLPHLKKCRRALTKDERRQITNSGSCYSSADRPHSDFPIVWKLDSNRLLGWVPFVHRNDKLWTEKQSKAVWRGRLTGQALSENRAVLRSEVSEKEYCRALKRCNFVLQHHNSTMVDARLITLQSKKLSEKVDGVPLLGDKKSMRELLDYKVLIVMEGNDVASGLGWSLRSNSVVMMPRPTFTSWLMEELLEPWVHYIPLNDKLDDVEEKMEWIRENDAEAEQIAIRGSLWMADLLEHPNVKSDDERIFRGILERYERFFVPSWTLQKQYDASSSTIGSWDFSWNDP